MKLEFRTENDVGDQVLEVIFDREGLDTLLKRLNFLAEQKTDHLHLFSEAWGTGDLTQSEDDRTAYNQVNIYLAGEGE